ncbi:hypothetical protein [Paucidesulfovibrio longus]|uniref:hypothetical protein n=1 Tax=Paucidesulfovibrio longus TaxID=889 RepID=UPI00138AF16B|nr:hypothetical protein [Paucidesulfovibrio longus]
MVSISNIKLNSSDKIKAIWIRKYICEDSDKYLVDNFIQNILSKIDFSNIKPQTRINLVLEQLLLNFIYCYSKYNEGIVIPFASDYWVKSNAYNPLGFSKDIIQIVNKLADSGFFQIRKGHNNFISEYDVKKGKCTIITLTDKFKSEYLNALIGRVQLRPEIDPIYVHEKKVEMKKTGKKKKDGERRERKSKYVKAINYYERKPKVSHTGLGLSYRINIEKEEEFIKEYNQLLSQFEFTMEEMPDFKKAALVQCAFDNADTFAFGQVRRVFNKIDDTNFTHGGRFYGHFIQCLYNRRLGVDGKPLKLREYILINGKKTVELDYNCLHANMLYARSNNKPFQGDAYTIKGYEHWRNECKVAMLIVFNSENKDEAQKAFQKKIYDSNGFLKNLTTEEIGTIFDGLMELHAPIAKWFFSGVGTRLQNIDSCIASNVLKFFTKQEKPCLPIHDSFIVWEEDDELLRKKMLEEYQRVLKTSNTIGIG